MTRDRKRDPRALSRDALRRATDGAEADTSRLVSAVPEMLAEAERRRRAASGEGAARDAAPDALMALVPVGRRMLPALASVAALLVAAALIVELTVNGDQDLRTVEDLVLIDDASGSIEDPLLDALFERENGNG